MGEAACRPVAMGCRVEGSPRRQATALSLLATASRLFLEMEMAMENLRFSELYGQAYALPPLAARFAAKLLTRFDGAPQEIISLRIVLLDRARSSNPTQIQWAMLDDPLLAGDERVATDATRARAFSEACAELVARQLQARS